MKFEFVEQKEKYNARIKVIGIGGGGGNAVNNMLASTLKGVDFVIANTDRQNIDNSKCPHRIQLGPSITMGLGAGADPEIGRISAEESIKEIREAIEGCDMVFITAGMGGGTGTGASPVVARECKEAGALTVAVVTKPFKFEGEPRMKRAIQGMECLKEEVDSLIVIPNERLKALGDSHTTFKELAARADNVLLQAVKGISDLIMSNGFINLDFADVKKVMAQMGTALMGTGRASGEKRAVEASQMAINSPLLEDISVKGAKGLLMNITGHSSMTMDEIDEASCYIKDEVHEDAEIFWGVVFDDDMGDEVQVTVIATGIDGDQFRDVGRYLKPQDNVVNIRDVVGIREAGIIRDVSPEEAEDVWTVKLNGEILDESLDIPTYQRKGAGIWSSADRAENKGMKKGFLNKFRIRENLDYPTFLRAKAD